MIQWTILQLSPKPQMSQRRSSTMCSVVERPDPHCGDGLVSCLRRRLLMSCVTQELLDLESRNLTRTFSRPTSSTAEHNYFRSDANCNIEYRIKVPKTDSPAWYQIIRPLLDARPTLVIYWMSVAIFKLSSAAFHQLVGFLLNLFIETVPRLFYIDKVWWL